MGPDGLRSLCESEILLNVDTLSLAGNRLDDKAADILANCKAAGRMVTLDLYGNTLSEEAQSKIKNSPHLKSLKALQVDW